jgi:hypothetical protein
VFKWAKSGKWYVTYKRYKNRLWVKEKKSNLLELRMGKEMLWNKNFVH